MRHAVLSGADRLNTVSSLLRHRKIGLMTNPTGINRQFDPTLDILHREYGLSALFAVEHGIRGDIQAGDQVDTTVDRETGVTIFSAYGKNSRFNEEMLSAFDVLVFDIQDVGARFYTFLYSLSYAMEACAKAGKSMIVLDRINPLGGVKRCGTVLDEKFSSFVGNYALPTQYGLTIGEYARYVKDYLRLDVDLTVVPLQGWRRDMLLSDIDIPWVAPSPNCPNLETALCYIGNCIFEGSNISEGRGTTLPFQVIGAPFLDGAVLEKRMNALDLPGMRFRRVSFRPTFSKFAGESCQGVQMHVTDRSAFDPFLGGIALMDEIRAQAGDQFAFLTGLEGKGYFIDLLLGTDAYRTGQYTGPQLAAAYAPKVAAFGRMAEKYFLY